MNNSILLLNTSSKKIEFGFAKNGELIFSQRLDPEYNADTISYFIKKAFENYKINFDETGYVSLSNGPGSFTGLRIGSAIAKGICFALGIGLIELRTLDIIANKFKSDKPVTSLIFSNMKTSEFYHCTYSFGNNKIIRLTDYNTSSLEKILESDGVFVSDDNLTDAIPENYSKKIIDTSESSNIPSMLELSVDSITENKISDYKISEPFYMKDFEIKKQF